MPCVSARIFCLTHTFTQGSTLLSLICAHDHDPLPGEDGAAGDENGTTPLQKQLDALHALFKGSVQVGQNFHRAARACLNTYHETMSVGSFVLTSNSAAA